MGWSRLPDAQTKFLGHGGTNLRFPIDQLPPGSWSLVKNLRMYFDGTWTLRGGLTLISNSFGSASYLHSILRVSDSNPDTLVGWSIFVGADANLYVGQNDTDFNNSTFNPIGNYQQPGTPVAFSGNPLSLVTMRPEGLGAAAVYIGDYYAVSSVPQPMKVVVFRPQDSLSTNGPAVYTMGVGPPNDVPVPTAGSAGQLNGTYWYRFAARNIYTGARSNPSQATRVDMTSDPLLPGIGGGLVLASQKATMTLPQDGPGGATSFGGAWSSNADFVIDVYRFSSIVPRWALVGSGDPGDTFLDDLPDTSVLSAPSFPLDSAGQPALVRPFPVPDIYRTGTHATLSTQANGSTLLTLSSGEVLNVNWPPGTRIWLDTKNGYTTYGYPTSTTTVELREDAYGEIGAGAWEWAIPAGTIIEAQPVGHLWGPYGGGSQGLVVFGCGSPLDPGTLFWTNGNDADSSAFTNSLEITDPSEPLVNGLLYDGRCYVWSTKQMFEIVPDWLNPGQFLARRIPNAGGLYAPWGVADCGAFMAFVGYDGIYKSTGVGSESLTDDALYPMFNHDGQPAQAVVRGGDTLYPPDPNSLQKHRLSWAFGELYFDYPEVTSGLSKAWVRGTRPGTDRGWILDDYHFDGATSRTSETTPDASAPTHGISDILVGIGGSLYTFTNATNLDGSFGITIALESGLGDAGDPRAGKLWGDSALEVNVANSTATTGLTLTHLGDPVNSDQPTVLLGPTAIPGSTSAVKVLLLTGVNLLNRTLGFRVLGTVTPNGSTIGVPEFYGWSPSWIPKPETVGTRVGDWTDDGKPGNKLVRGCVIEGDTATATGTDLVVDGTLATKVTASSHSFVSGDVGSHLVTLSGTGFARDTFVIVSVSSGAAILDHAAGVLGSTGGSWALGAPKSLQVQSDGGSLQTTLVVSHPGQSEFPYFWASPFETHELRLAPVDAVLWREFRVRWIYDDYPEYGAQVPDFEHLGTPSYLRGFELEVSTKGQVVGFQIQTDLGNVVSTQAVTLPERGTVVYAFAPPVVATEFRLVPLGPWEKFALRLIADPYPDLGAIYTPWLAPAGGRPAYVRGLNIRGDTLGNSLAVRVVVEGGTLAYTIPAVKLSGQSVQNYPIPVPVVTHLLQLQPIGPWRWFETTFEAEEYPEFTTELSPVLTPWGGGAAYVREAVIPCDTQGATQGLQLLGDGNVIDAAPTLTATGKQGVPVAFVPPFVAHRIQMQPLGLLRLWGGEIKWIFDPYPELLAGLTGIRKLGGCRLVQGLRLVADTGGQAVAFKIFGDEGVLQVTLPATSFPGKSMIAFPRTNEWPPFFAHELQVQALGGARIWEDELEWITEPAPDLATGWGPTPPITGPQGQGWQNFWLERWCWLAYAGPGAPTLTITPDVGPPETYNFPSAGGRYVRNRLPLLPGKAKSRTYAVAASAPFRLYLEDSFVTAKPWGSPGGFQALRVFGDLSIVSGARI